MATIADISIGIQADTARFDAAMAKSQDNVQSFGSAVNAQTSKVGELATATTPIATAATKAADGFSRLVTTLAKIAAAGAAIAVIVKFRTEILNFAKAALGKGQEGAHALGNKISNMAADVKKAAVGDFVKSIKNVGTVGQAALGSIGPLAIGFVRLRKEVALAASDSTLMQRAIEKLSRSISALAGVMPSFGGAVKRGITAPMAAAAIGVGAILTSALVYLRSEISATIAAFAKMDKTAKIADSIGATTESITRMNYVAGQTGANAEQMQNGLTEMVKRVGEAGQKGTGPAAEALAALGVSARELQGLAPDESFMRLSDALRGVESIAQRNFLADQLFGGDAKNLMGALNMGSEGLIRIGMEADKVGATFNRIDAAKIEMANDAWGRLQMILEVSYNQLAIALAPAWAMVSRAIGDFMVAQGGAGKTIQAMVEKALTAAGFLVDIWNLAGGAAAAFSSGVNGVMGNVLTAIASTLARIVTVVGNAVADITSYVSEDAAAAVRSASASAAGFIENTAVAAGKGMIANSEKMAERSDEMIKNYMEGAGNKFIEAYRSGAEEIQKEAEEKAASIESVNQKSREVAQKVDLSWVAGFAKDKMNQIGKFFAGGADKIAENAKRGEGKEREVDALVVTARDVIGGGEMFPKKQEVKDPEGLKVWERIEKNTAKMGDMSFTAR